MRHRLNDDWAYGNDPDARPWDFQAEECALRACVDRFNSRRYNSTIVSWCERTYYTVSEWKQYQNLRKFAKDIFSEGTFNILTNSNFFFF